MTESECQYTPAAMLSWLGESPDADAVADKLRSLGVRGLAGSVAHCPVANAVKLTGVIDVMVGKETEWRSGSWYSMVETPPSVVDFTERFDEGDFPYLKSCP